MLDLGAVGDVAEVRVNGRVAGTAWHAPWTIDIGPLLHAGSNQLEVRVGNLWVNRLIGDAQPGAEKITFTAAPTYKPDAPPRASGLIGPVRLLTSHPAERANPDGRSPAEDIQPSAAGSWRSGIRCHPAVRICHVDVMA